MASLPYMQFYVADYLADTFHLSTIEHGAYLLLIFNYWQRGESFKAKDQRSLNKRLASAARMSDDEWDVAKETLREFFITTDDEWTHPRIERDLEAVKAKSRQASEAGKASAAKRSRRSAGNMNGRSTDAQRTFNHTDTDTDTDTESAVALSAPAREVSAEQKISPPPVAVATRPGALAVLLRQHGVSATPQQPHLLAWVDAELSDAEALEAIARARDRKPEPARISTSYLNCIVGDIIAERGGSKVRWNTAEPVRQARVEYR